ncbi:MAG: penicillin-binding protein, partial [Alphaproteobacteria bacterium]|nr:penicillin-binding protein [Alphaproteobacteria bacterium]
GPAMPEGWQPPSPVESLIGRIGDLFGDSPPAEADPLDESLLEPLPRDPAPPRRTDPGPAVVRPTAPQPQRDPPDQRPEPAPPPEKKAEPLFF